MAPFGIWAKTKGEIANILEYLTYAGYHSRQYTWKRVKVTGGDAAGAPKIRKPQVPFRISLHSHFIYSQAPYYQPIHLISAVLLMLFSTRCFQCFCICSFSCVHTRIVDSFLCVWSRKERNFVQSFLRPENYAFILLV